MFVADAADELRSSRFYRSDPHIRHVPSTTEIIDAYHHTINKKAVLIFIVAHDGIKELEDRAESSLPPQRNVNPLLVIKRPFSQS
jgi:hypothetical protein